METSVKETPSMRTRIKSAMVALRQALIAFAQAYRLPDLSKAVFASPVVKEALEHLDIARTLAAHSHLSFVSEAADQDAMAVDRSIKSLRRIAKQAIAGDVWQQILLALEVPACDVVDALRGIVRPLQSLTDELLGDSLEISEYSDYFASEIERLSSSVMLACQSALSEGALRDFSPLRETVKRLSKTAAEIREGKTPKSVLKPLAKVVKVA